MRMKTKRNCIAPSTATLTQSGLLAELLRYQRRKVIELTPRRAYREHGRGFLANSFAWLLARAHSLTGGRRFLRGFEEGTLPRPT
jgi:hypothetical protein